VPTLKPGETYLIESVVRTLKLGHHFTQGTVDSNEVWLDVVVRSGDRVIGRSGGIDDQGEVDPWSHFMNVYMLDKDGNRIDRRNPQDIFTPLYNHQIPPGAGQVAHFELQLPEKLSAPVTVELKLQYRKFDKQYMDFVTKSAKTGDLPIRDYTPGQPWHNNLPITTLAADSVTFPVEGVEVEIEPQKSAIADLWQRWNDYGIGLLLEGIVPGATGGKAELLQAEQAFEEVKKLGRFDGPLNLARVYFTEGRLEDAVKALNQATEFKEPAAPPWTVAWFHGLVNKQNGHLDAAIANFRSVLYDMTPAMRERRFDFSKDYVVLNELGQTLFERSKQERGESKKADRERLQREAVLAFEATLELDSEDVMAHYNLAQLYRLLGDQERAEEHRLKHLRYKPDDNAQDRAVNLARKKSEAADHAAEKLVIYRLQRKGAPGLPDEAAIEQADGRRGAPQKSEVRSTTSSSRTPSSAGGGE
jgi:tetratricopeptide (TPR) repeat protein